MGKKKQKHPVKSPVVELTPIKESDRLEFMIQLNKSAMSENDTEIDRILDQQIDDLTIRISEIKK